MELIPVVWVKTNHICGDCSCMIYVDRDDPNHMKCSFCSWLGYSPYDNVNVVYDKSEEDDLDF